jgi:hypothetical protein
VLCGRDLCARAGRGRGALSNWWLSQISSQCLRHPTEIIPRLVMGQQPSHPPKHSKKRRNSHPQTRNRQIIEETSTENRRQRNMTMEVNTWEVAISPSSIINAPRPQP